MPAYDYINDFWGGLPVEWSYDTNQPERIKDGAGRTDEQLDLLEKQCGHKFPKLYRDQYKVQNGGYPKRDSFIDKNGVQHGVFVNDSHLFPLTNNYYSLREWMHNIWDDDEIAEHFPDWNLDKLHIISFMWGHSLLCFDYGYLEDEYYAEPQVVCIETNYFEEVFRAANYTEFIASLDYYNEDDE